MATLLETVNRYETERVYNEAMVMARNALAPGNSLTFPPEWKLKNSHWISPKTQNLLLHFSPLIQPDDNGKVNFPKEDEVFLKKIKGYPWGNNMPIMRTTENDNLRERSKENVKTTIDFINDGYSSKDNRRTGEKYHIHVLRTFLRGNSEMHYYGNNKRSSFYTSLLARILHDSKEDFDNFKITMIQEGVYNDAPLFVSKPMGKYELTFDGQKERKYILELEPKEAKQLELQIEALTIPKEIAKLPNGDDKTEKQIQHLLDTTQNIHDEIGPLEAYQTLRIKLDDRIDNILTYFQTNSEFSSEKLRAKLKETILFFREVEVKAEEYFKEYSLEYKRLNGREIETPVSDSAESIVSFCYFLLNGGTYDNFFKPTLEFEDKIMRGKTKEQLTHKYSDTFLIPYILYPTEDIRVITPGPQL